MSAFLDTALDPATLERARAGDDAALAAIYRAFEVPVRTLARRIVTPRSAAEDVAQDVFVDVITRLHQFEGRGSFAGWVRSIAVSTLPDAPALAVAAWPALAGRVDALDRRAAPGLAGSSAGRARRPRTAPMRSTSSARWRSSATTRGPSCGCTTSRATPMPKSARCSAHRPVFPSRSLPARTSACGTCCMSKETGRHACPYRARHEPARPTPIVAGGRAASDGWADVQSRVAARQALRSRATQRWACSSRPRPSVAIIAVTAALARRGRRDRAPAARWLSNSRRSRRSRRSRSIASRSCRRSRRRSTNCWR